MYLLLCPTCKGKDDQLVNLMKSQESDYAFCPSCGYTISIEELDERS
jgi:uncharacterized protein YbaR (Trm112 family)